MKKIQIVALGILLVTAFSCKQTKKEEKKEEPTASSYSIVQDSTDVRFTAYKTTDKVPVGGTFEEVELTYTSGETPIETLNGLEFTIPISSLFTNDPTEVRDPKIIEFFFDKMIETQSISGVFTFKDDQTCTVNLSMNGVTTELPMEYEITDDNYVNFSGVMDLKQWDALDALAALHEACEILHTGADGISKTWEDVAINASVLLEQN
ncbi:YceI family protein [Allomuricauda sp. F6463D]|uniref:YceI family protein n=1 Tax=Allomuricauda sp. F6463D TaxID=2926409 RepID=UPI001FF5B592|nr:YceI family protein [Muricauda sp. F6463D]MCK0159935.1 YceI family protein [Muricauda sp. F6463D]